MLRRMAELSRRERGWLRFQSRFSARETTRRDPPAMQLVHPRADEGRAPILESPITLPPADVCRAEQGATELMKEERRKQIWRWRFTPARGEWVG